MAFTIQIASEAIEEAIIAYKYYEQAAEGLGERFLSALEHCYSKILQHSDHYSFVQNSDKLRDIQLRRFPYVVIFYVHAHTIHVVSVRNTSQKPII